MRRQIAPMLYIYMYIYIYIYIYIYKCEIGFALFHVIGTKCRSRLAPRPQAFGWRFAPGEWIIYLLYYNIIYYFFNNIITYQRKEK